MGIYESCCLHPCISRLRRKSSSVLDFAQATNMDRRHGCHAAKASLTFDEGHKSLRCKGLHTLLAFASKCRTLGLR